MKPLERSCSPSLLPPLTVALVVPRLSLKLDAIIVNASRKELAQVAIVFVKLGLLTSIMSVVFVVCALWASVVFHNNLKGYQVDYI